MGDELNNRLSNNFGGDSVAYIQYGAGFADHTYIIERRNSDGFYRMYQSWVEHYKMEAWLQPDPLHTVVEVNGNKNLLDAAKVLYGGGQWFDPATAFTADMNTWYAGTNQNTNTDTGNVPTGAKTALEQLHGVPYGGKMPTTKVQHAVVISVMAAPLNHECDTGSSAFDAVFLSAPSADCQFCVSLLGSALKQKDLDAYCNSNGMDIDAVACDNFKKTLPFTDQKTALKYVTTNEEYCTSNVDCCAFMNHCSTTMVPTDPHPYVGKNFVELSSSSRKIKRKMRRMQSLTRN
jgi:hypothetical protein